MAYTPIDNPGDFFNTVLYTGNGASSRSITGVGFQPDWVWNKPRTDTNDHQWVDSVRTGGKVISSNLADAEYTAGNTILSFISDGFTCGNGASVNANNIPYASWNWKAGTSFTNDASATGIGTIDSTGSVNTDAGFSIISFAGASTVSTVAHGLGVAPKMMIFKNRSDADHWGVYHQSLGSNAAMYLNLTGAVDGTLWNNTAPTTSVFTVQNNSAVNGSGNNIIAYCFAEKQGYSKFGSYTGNGNADGTFVYTGFKPAYVMTKSSATTSNWEIKDNKRLGYNTVDTYIKANASAAEDTGVSSHAMDFLSNGFKHRGNNDEVNGSGEAYIYMAFAESPFTNSGFVPNNAR